MKLVMKKLGREFVLQFKENPTDAYCGHGLSPDAAIADFVRYYQKELGVEIIIDKSAVGAEIARRLVVQQIRNLGTHAVLLERQSQQRRHKCWLIFH